jgi:RNA polymerase sigma-54 factor
MKPNLSMAQKQTLTMTPKLQQAIKIMQMTRLELSQYINQQMTENPILEEAYDDIEEDSDEPEIENEDDELIDIPESDMDLETGLPETNSETSVTEDIIPEMDIVDDNFGDMNWIDYFEDNGTGSIEFEEPQEERRDNSASEESLQDHLLSQLRLSVNSDDYEIGVTIIGDINDDGRLVTDIEETAKSSGYSLSDIKRVLQIIQGFDPSGIGARNLEECLLIQLQQKNLEGTVPYRLVSEGYLKDLAANRYPQIAKGLGVSLNSVREAVAIIKKLEARPGRPYSPVRNEFIIPDVIIEKIDDEYKILMNDYGLGLRISPYYKSILNSEDGSQKETKKFMQSQYENAVWFLESLERRRRTIHKVAEVIFDVQEDFLEKGPVYLKPLTLKDVADVVRVHESTVSRVTRGRYAQTPQGVFELKHFFSSGISSGNGEMASSTSVKDIIKNVISEENQKKPLSDDEIVKILNEKGFKIARRTIAKYREELNIPPSSKRKQW